MIIHFVCEGNTFRSRLAEAYLKSKNTAKLQVLSSGTKANLNKNGPLCWYAQRIMLYNNFISFTSMTWRQISKTELEQADLVIFIGQQNYDYVLREIQPKLKKSYVWKIKDLWEYGFSSDNHSIEEDVKRIQATEEVYQQIKQNVDQLIQEVTS